MDWKRKEITYPQGEIPESTIYRTSSEILFITLMATLKQIDISQMHKVNRILNECGKNIYYDMSRYKFYNRSNELPLSWTEVVMEMTGKVR